MGVSHTLRCSWRDKIPTRFALASKATCPFQGEVRAIVANHKKRARFWGGQNRA
jgi:hypothetical protein